LAFDVGLQRERTSLAWTRTALAMVANGLLVLVRHEHSFPLAVSVLLSSAWVALALATLWCAAQRHHLVLTPDRHIRPATRTLTLLSLAVALACALTAGSIALS
jgi:uncharacterized membrane protein YidH (DUF202 family)